MSIQNVKANHLLDVETFHWPVGGPRGTVRASPNSLGLIVWGP